MILVEHPSMPRDQRTTPNKLRGFSYESVNVLMTHIRIAGEKVIERLFGNGITVTLDRPASRRLKGLELHPEPRSCDTHGLSEPASLEEIDEAIYVHGDSWSILPMELAPTPFTEHGPARKAHLRSENPDTQSRSIPLVSILNPKVLRIPVFVLGDPIVHAALEFGDQAIEPEGRPLQDVVLGVALAQEFLGRKKLFPVLEYLWAKTSLIVRPRHFWFPFLWERLFLGHKGAKGLPVLVPDFHHSGSLGVKVLFVTHRATLDHVVPAVYHTPDQPARFVLKRTEMDSERRSLWG
jgi:hypothetical protein